MPNHAYHKNNLAKLAMHNHDIGKCKISAQLNEDLLQKGEKTNKLCIICA